MCGFQEIIELDNKVRQVIRVVKESSGIATECVDEPFKEVGDAKTAVIALVNWLNFMRRRCSRN